MPTVNQGRHPSVQQNVSVTQQPQPQVQLPPTAVRPEVQATGPIYYTVGLPSHGKFGYPENVQYRDIMVRDEKILSTATRGNYVQTLNDILKSLIGNPTYYEDLTVYDRDFLLVWIWANNYNPVKTIEVACDNCGAKENMEVDLTKLPVKDVDPTLAVPFVLETADGKSLNLRLVTVGMQLAVDAYVKSHPDCDEDTALYSLTVDNGVVMPMDSKVTWVETNITGKTMALVRAFHEYYQYGVQDRLEHTCSTCREVTKFRAPFRPEWLRPSLSNDFATLLQSNKESTNQPT